MALAMVSSQLLLFWIPPGPARLLQELVMNLHASHLRAFMSPFLVATFLLSSLGKTYPADAPLLSGDGDSGGESMDQEAEPQKEEPDHGVRAAHRRAFPVRTLRHNPLSPAVSQWPAGKGSQDASDSPQPLTSQLLGTS